jgi:hypothetical protein
MKKRLRGAAYGFAHHCQSGLSFIQPHMSQELRRRGLDELRVQFLPSLSVEPEIAPEAPLRRALAAAGERLIDILASHQIVPADIARASAAFRAAGGDDYSTSVEVVFVSREGAEVSRRL